MIDLHTVATANGYKASILLEELGLPYRAIAYDLRAGEHQKPAFLALNPIGRLPAIVDNDPANAAPIVTYGTAAIALYLAEKTGRLLPHDLSVRAKAYEWVGIAASDLSPAFSGQFVFGVLAPEQLPWAIDYYERLCLRLLAAMEARLTSHHYLAGAEYSIADILAYPIAATSMLRFPGNLASHPAIARWAGELAARPAVSRGMHVPA